MDGDRQREAERVDHHVLLPALNLLVPVYLLAGRVGVVRGLDALGVDDPQAGALLTASGLARGGRGGSPSHPRTHPRTSTCEVIVHGQPRGKVSGEHTPLATCLDYVKCCVYYPAERMFPLPFLHIYDFFYNLPLIISEVGKQLLNLE